MAGTVVADTLSDGAGNTTAMDNAIYGSTKAWVNFTGSSGGINASYNVSSVTRNGTGDYSVNFTNAFSDANYSVYAAGRRNNSTQRGMVLCMNNTATYAQYTTYYRFQTSVHDSFTVEDPLVFWTGVNR